MTRVDYLSGASMSSMVDCAARFIRQIGRGRRNGNSEQLQVHPSQRAVLSEEDPIRAVFKRRVIFLLRPEPELLHMELPRTLQETKLLS